MKFKTSFEKAMNWAETISDSASAVGTLVVEAIRKARNSSKLHYILDKINAMVKMIKAVSNGSYSEYSKSAILKAIAAMAYLVWPADAIPDFIPITGLIDDAAVIMYVFNQIEDEIIRFQIWEKSRSGKH